MKHDHVQIVCPGPSLQFRKSRIAPCDCRIGVNRAVSAVPCTWWAFGDWQNLVNVVPIGKPNIFTNQQAMELFEAHIGPLKKITAHMELIDAVDFVEYEDLKTDCPLPLNPGTWTFAASLMLARHFDAKTIDVFGCDWEGTQDWDGAQQAERSKERWDRERVDVGKVVQWLRESGVTVNGIPGN